MERALIEIHPKRSGLKAVDAIGVIKCKLHKNGKSISINRLMNLPRYTKFNCQMKIDGDECNIVGIAGNHAIWLPFGNGQGLKIVFNDRPLSPTLQLETLDVIAREQSDIFPKVEWFALAQLQEQGNKTRQCMLIMMEEVKRTKVLSPGEKAFEGAQPLLQCPLSVSDRCNKEFQRLHLLPDDEWYKSVNLFGSKIIDFHGFELFSSRYVFPTGVGKKELEKIYEHGPRWSTRKKGKEITSEDTLYQGFNFTGYTMRGYSSDGEQFDSYRKLAFLPMRKVARGRVLDIGYCQGFFSFQSLTHGAREVIGIEHSEKHAKFAKELNEKWYKSDKVDFQVGDAADYVTQHRDEKFNVIFLLSVLHQMYPNMKGSGTFLDRLARMSRYTAFETPIDHPKMKLSVTAVDRQLKKHFKQVRLLYTYDAYSPGYRAIFICYGNDVPSNPKAFV